MSKYWWNSSFRSFLDPCGLSKLKKKLRGCQRGAYILVWQPVWIMKLLHDCILYDPLKHRGHFGGLPGLPLTKFRVVFDVSVENFWNKRNVWKGIRLFSLLENSRRKFGFRVFKPFLNISFRLSQPFFLKRNWLRQMVKAIKT